jgi:hypothetical protein
LTAKYVAAVVPVSWAAWLLIRLDRFSRIRVATFAQDIKHGSAIHSGVQLDDQDRPLAP